MASRSGSWGCLVGTLKVFDRGGRRTIPSPRSLVCLPTVPASVRGKHFCPINACRVEAGKLPRSLGPKVLSYTTSFRAEEIHHAKPFLPSISQVTIPPDSLLNTLQEPFPSDHSLIHSPHTLNLRPRNPRSPLPSIHPFPFLFSRYR